MAKRFNVALSFPGEDRTFVLQVAEALAEKLSRERVFYDEWYEAELLGTDGDLKLRAKYEDADLVVPFFSEHYDKPWCSVEWETIRGILLNRRKDDAVIPVHLDDTDVPGWSAVNFGIRLRGRTPSQIADVILQVLDQRRSGIPSAASPAAPTTAAPGPKPTPAAPSPTPGALVLWQEKLDYLQQQEPITTGAEHKFALKKQIEEAKQKIREHGGNPN